MCDIHTFPMCFRILHFFLFSTTWALNLIGNYQNSNFMEESFRVLVHFIITLVFEITGNP